MDILDYISFILYHQRNINIKEYAIIKKKKELLIQLTFIEIHYANGKKKS